MKRYIKSIILVLLLIMASRQAFPQVNRNGMIGLVDLYDNQLFVNIAKSCFVADNEKYFPCLFTIEFPNTINDYWFNLGRISEYIFKFEKNQFVFVYDDVKKDIILAETPLCFLQEKKIYEVNKDSADGIILSLENHYSEWSPIGFESIANSFDGHFYVATCSNILFIFYNITDLNIQKIITSFIVIRPHLMQIGVTSD